MMMNFIQCNSLLDGSHGMLTFTVSNQSGGSYHHSTHGTDNAHGSML